MWHARSCACCVVHTGAHPGNLVVYHALRDALLDIRCIALIAPPVLAVSDALAVLREGTRNRQVAATDMNAASSRSHCIFTCHIESRLEPQPGMVNVRSSRLHLVDLAGSERLKTSWASAAAAAAAAGGTGAVVSSSWDGGSMSGGGGAGGNSRLRETTSINSSLTVLGLVILRLTEQQPHIPYRNSKLTFLLQVRTWSCPHSGLAVCLHGATC